MTVPIKAPCAESAARAARGRTIGTWSGFTAITAAIGPVLGGWLVENALWRWVFFINLPIVGVVILLSLWRVPGSHNEAASKSLDWPEQRSLRGVWARLRMLLSIVQVVQLRHGGMVFFRDPRGLRPVSVST